MTTRKLAGPAAVVLALAAAVALAVVAADVLRSQRALEAGDVRFAARTASMRAWTPETVLPAGVSRTLLGVEDDLAVRRALQRFRISRPRSPIRSFDDVGLRSAAEGELARAARSDPGPEQEALLANLRGVLALEEARAGESQAPVLLRRAAARFRGAIRLDARFEDAKFNLELALRLLRGPESGSGRGGGQRADTPASGAGTASAGSGY